MNGYSLNNNGPQIKLNKFPGNSVYLIIYRYIYLFTIFICLLYLSILFIYYFFYYLSCFKLFNIFVNFYLCTI